MSHQRQAQWTHRLRHIQALRDRFRGAGRYDRAYRAHLALQQVYDRWAQEVFSAARAR